MKTSSKKAKGQELQKWIAEQISNLLNVPFGKDEEIASRPSGQSGTDVILSPRIRKLFPFSIEAKNHYRWNIHKDIKQAIENCYEDTDWLLFYKRKSRKKEERIGEVVVMDARSFFKLLEKIYVNKEKQIKM
jgi:hypothetical protein